MYCEQSIKCVGFDNIYCQERSLLLEEPYGMLTIICLSSFKTNLIIIQ